MKAPCELKRKFIQLWPHLNERARRMVAAEEAMRLGRGGISLVSRACGLSRVAQSDMHRHRDNSRTQRTVEHQSPSGALLARRSLVPMAQKFCQFDGSSCC